MAAKKKITNLIDADFFAKVEKLPAESVFPNFKFNSYNSSVVKVTDNEGNEHIVNNCSDNYLLVDNNLIFPILEKELKAFGRVKIQRKVIDYSSFFVDYDFIKKENARALKNGIIIYPRLSAQNSYNSRYLFKLSPVFYREDTDCIMCLPIDDEDFDAVLSHCSGQEDEIEEAIESIKDFITDLDSIVEAYDELFNKVLAKDTTQIQKVIDTILRKAKCLISLENDIVEYILTKNSEKQEINYFDLYEGINFHLNHSANYNSTTIRQIDEKILDVIYGLVEK